MLPLQKRKLFYYIDTYQRYLGGLTPPVEKYFRNFRPCGEILFAQNRGFFRNFRDVSTYNTPKITFYFIFINKFPKNFEKSAQKFFAAPSAPKTSRNTPIFRAVSVDGAPLP